MLIAFLVLAILVALFLFCSMPSLYKHKDLQFIKGKYIAHRGLHNLKEGYPENSIPAFKRATEFGLAIENDIHLTKDGEVVVFHDDDLKRACGVNKKVSELTLKELKEYNLFETSEKIPTLKECLEVVRGKTPLLIEFKSDGGNHEKLVIAANEILKEYKGLYLIQSFYPQILYYYRKHNKNVCRGFLATAFKGEAFYKRLSGALVFNFISRPHFVSYEHKFNNYFFLKLNRLLGAFTIAWTFHSKTEVLRVKKEFKAYIFEDFIP